MAHMTIYSKSNCIKCDAVLRTINKALRAGTIAPSQVTVQMVDGTQPRPGKVEEHVEVVSLTDPAEQASFRAFVAAHPGLGPVMPIVVLRDGDDAELDAFNDVLPDRVKAAVRALAETAPELAASR